MSATGGLSQERDMFAMVKPHLRPKTRQESSNLRNADIEGKLHRHKFHFIHHLSFSVVLRIQVLHREYGRRK